MERNRVVVDLTYSSVPDVDSVVILGAGPSLNKNMKFVNEYMKRNKSIVISCNYNMPGINAEYTIYIGGSNYKQNIQRSKSPNIIVNKKILRKCKIRNKKKNYLVMRSAVDSKLSNIPKYWNETSIHVKPNGEFGHHLSNCGFTALLASHYFHPKKVIVAGLDGPFWSKKTKRYPKVLHFTGETRGYKGKVHSDPRIVEQKGRFLSLIFDFLTKQGIKVGVFDNEHLWCARMFPKTKCVVDAKTL